MIEKNRQKKFEILQLLRIIAAVGIYVYHTGRIGERGFFGVEIFNILSGFLVMYSTKANGGKNFLVKRMIRIIPVYWFYTLIMFFILLVKPEMSVMRSANVPDLLRSLFFIPFVSPNGYSVPILIVGWTLNYEMFFYLLFFISMRINFRYRAVVFNCIICIFIITGKICSYPFVLKYYSTVFLFEYSLGMIIYYCYNFIKEHNYRIKYRLFWIVVATAAFAFLAVNEFSSNMDTRVICIGLPAFLLVASCLVLFDDLHINKYLLAGGSVTYSFYLIECFSTAGYKIIAQRFGYEIPLMILILAVTFLCSYVSYIFLEEKSRKILNGLLLQKNLF